MDKVGASFCDGRYLIPGNRSLRVLSLAHNEMGAAGLSHLLGRLAEFASRFGPPEEGKEATAAEEPASAKAPRGRQAQQTSGTAACPLPLRRLDVTGNARLVDDDDLPHLDAARHAAEQLLWVVRVKIEAGDGSE